MAERLQDSIARNKLSAAYNTHITQSASDSRQSGTAYASGVAHIQMYKQLMAQDKLVQPSMSCKHSIVSEDGYTSPSKVAKAQTLVSF